MTVENDKIPKRRKKNKNLPIAVGHFTAGGPFQYCFKMVSFCEALFNSVMTMATCNKTKIEIRDSSTLKNREMF